MISAFFIDRPRFAFVISIVMTLAGLVALFTLPVAQYPDITPGQVSITATYPGADAGTVQETVIQPVETQINGVKNLLYITSTTTDTGSAVINAVLISEPTAMPIRSILRTGSIGQMPSCRMRCGGRVLS